MGNVFRLVRRDVLRLLRVPAAWVICAGLVVIPSLYAWFNIYGFWNPYGNTKSIQVAVVNEDKGTTNDTLGKLDLGDQIVTAMKANDQLGWHFVSRDQAMDEVKTGKSSAAFVIPKDFSAKLATIISGDFQQPKLEYYVNEKANAIAPKITDVGSSTLSTQINGTFVSTVSEVVSSTVNTKLAEAEGKVSAAQSNTVKALGRSEGNIEDARDAIDDLDDTVTTARRKAQNAKTTLDKATRQAEIISHGLQGTSKLLTSTSDSLTKFSSSMGATLDNGSRLMSQSAAKANLSVGKAAATITTAQGSVGAALATGKDINTQNAEIITELEDIQQALPKDSLAYTQLDQLLNGHDGDGKSGLKHTNQAVKQTLDNLGTLNDDTGKTATSVANAADTITAAAQGTLNTVDGYRSTLGSATIPQVNGGLAQLSSTANGLSGAITSQQGLIDQTKAILDQLDSTLATTSKALRQTDGTLKNIGDDLSTAKTDVAALSTSAAWQKLTKNGKLDAQKIANFMFAPTTLRTHALYPVNSYGSGMAPLFTDLSLWVGAFVLMVIVKLEADDEGIPGLTVGQAYMGRWLLLSILAVLQGIVCCVGDLVIGVQAANVPAFIATGVLSSLTYLSILYALSVTFQHVGKALCVVLIIVQIPGASGLYPIEMMPAFFRRLYPFFPFTYSIDALRETIGGFYGNHYAVAVGHLLVFAALSFILGLLLRPYLTNLNRLFAREIAQSDMIIGEEVQAPFHRYRFSQAIRAMANRAEYRAAIHHRAMKFARLYPRLKVGAIVAGVIVPCVLIVLFSVSPNFVSPNGKAIILASWAIWILLMIGFLIAIEYIRDNIERQLLLGSMNDDDIRSMFSVRDRLKNISWTPPKPQRRPRHAASTAGGESRDDEARDDDGRTGTVTEKTEGRNDA
ncbi:YhgE/Pip domain-containing protein [Bifidobacterium sp. 82T24]|uniref:YhgE/Pip domain-containing protein n=1 Tax=Bifidobacterium pluvialisilvae TaxID=2834436 RepID=UPI001C574A2B|nr:YhgE/Pip domain-containing protein [Bifidobacterium pluvialisilvae]MBW3088619.1 YhgE/Pip domain-containing protein [Bifidobacterium pluvialisilvae]